MLETWHIFYYFLSDALNLVGFMFALPDLDDLKQLL